MTRNLKVLFTPADFAALTPSALVGVTCVVFDVLRATSTMLTALANGAEAVHPAAEIAEALALRSRWPGALLGGERGGRRITAAQAGGVEFDLGNSPREYTAERVRGRRIISTTTNGTRALRACVGAEAVLAGTFLNLIAVARWLEARAGASVLLVGAGTAEEAAWEDVLAAGALVEILAAGERWALADSAHFAQEAYLRWGNDLAGSMRFSSNGRRLLAQPDLAPDVEFCLRRDAVALVASMDADGALRAV